MRRVSTAIQHGVYDYHRAPHPIENGIRESTRKHPMIGQPIDGVNPAVKHQRINVREERINEIVSQTGTLSFVEAVTILQVFARGAKDLDLHDNSFRMRRFADSQSSTSS